MPKRIEYQPGQMVGNCIYISEAPKGKWERMANFKCPCGNEFIGRVAEVKSGHTTSCGCAINRVILRTKPLIHQFKSEYNTWVSMKDRCNNPNSEDYKHYGGRGIKVCERWFNSFDTFLSDLGPKPTPKHTIERYNVNEGYNPSNCGWLLNEEQPHNRTITVKLTHKGTTKPLSIWARELKIKPSTLRTRIERGYSIEKALSPFKYDSKGREIRKPMRPVLAFNLV